MITIDQNIGLKGEYKIIVNGNDSDIWHRNIITNDGFESFIKSSPTAHNGKLYRDILSKCEVGSGNLHATAEDTALSIPITNNILRTSLTTNNRPKISTIETRFQSCAFDDDYIIREIGIRDVDNFLVSRSVLDNPISVTKGDNIIIHYRLIVIRDASYREYASPALYTAYDTLGLPVEDFQVYSAQYTNIDGNIVNLLRSTVNLTDFPHTEMLLGKVNVLLCNSRETGFNTETNGPNVTYRLTRTDKDKMFKTYSLYDKVNRVLNMGFYSRADIDFSQLDSLIIASSDIQHPNADMADAIVPFSHLRFNKTDIEWYTNNAAYRLDRIGITIRFTFNNI